MKKQTNHNLHNLKEGEEVILDKDSAIESVVKIVKFTPEKLFVTISDSESEWTTMTSRLSPKEKQKKQEEEMKKSRDEKDLGI